MSASFPTAIASNSTLYLAVNELFSPLSSSLDAVTTTVVLTSTTGFPAVGLVVIGDEVIKYTGIAGVNITGCTRGFDGTTAAVHASGANVYYAICAAHHNNVKDEIIAIETALGANLSNVITTAGGKVSGTAPVSDPSDIDALELLYSSGGIVQAYNRFTSTWKPMSLDGSALALNVAGTNIVNVSAAGISFGDTSTEGIVGTVSADNAAAGNVGEYVQATVTSAADFPATGVYGDVASISLSEGDWDVTGQIYANTASVASVTSYRLGLSTHSGTSSSGLDLGFTLLGSTVEGSIALPRIRFNVSTPTTAYLKVSASYSGTAPKYVGAIFARRVR